MSVQSLLSHAAPMLLLDQILAWDEASVTTSAAVTPANPFVSAQGMPSHVGIELMAQTCGAWAGANALAAGSTVRQGYLLGTRRYTAAKSWFPLESRLEITAKVVFQDQNMGVFDCRIISDGEVMATAQLSVLQPDGD